jgi:hypothetical protein
MARESEYWTIRLEGRLNGDWAEGVTGGCLEHLPDGTTRLTGRFDDQSELLGFLQRLAGLGAHFNSIIRMDEETGCAKQ